MYRCCPSVRPSVRPSRASTQRKKRKGLRTLNLVGRIPGTRAPRGPISRFPAVAGVGRPYPKASVPPPRGKTKRPTYTKLGRKGPWDTSTPGPMTRSRGQRSRSRRLIALFAKNPHNFAACCPINLIFGRWRKDPLPPCPGCPRPFTCFKTSLYTVFVMISCVRHLLYESRRASHDRAAITNIIRVFAPFSSDR